MILIKEEYLTFSSDVSTDVNRKYPYSNLLFCIYSTGFDGSTIVPHHLSDNCRHVVNQISIGQKSFILFQIPTYRKQSFDCSESTYRNAPSPSPRPIGKWHSDATTFRFDAPRTLK